MNVDIHICPECGSRYVTRAPHMEPLMREHGSLTWCTGPATGGPPHPRPVACVRYVATVGSVT